ncbi:hypothetical protein VNO80_15699 [Phaseolus coccineus]|uniref:Uncharacterized protein n=1 Tax=Phaseolus coccineus TaxID=3886 RepID=A0AAN9MQC9_PHACN
MVCGLALPNTQRVLPKRACVFLSVVFVFLPALVLRSGFSAKGSHPVSCYSVLCHSEDAFFLIDMLGFGGSFKWVSFFGLPNGGGAVIPQGNTIEREEVGWSLGCAMDH